MAQIFLSAVAHFFVVVSGSKIHERVAHFFIDIYRLTLCANRSCLLFRLKIKRSIKKWNAIIKDKEFLECINVGKLYDGDCSNEMCTKVLKTAVFV